MCRASCNHVVQPDRRCVHFNAGVRHFTLTPTFPSGPLPPGRRQRSLVVLDANANRLGRVDRACRIVA